MESDIDSGEHLRRIQFHIFFSIVFIDGFLNFAAICNGQSWFGF